MFTNADEVLRFIGDNKVEFVDVRFCDLPGTMQHFTVPAGSFGQWAFTDGLMFDGSSIRGFQQIHESDMLLLPDPGTAVLDPFRQHPTLNLTSTNSTLWSPRNRSTSSALVNINPRFLSWRAAVKPQPVVRESAALRLRPYGPASPGRGEWPDQARLTPARRARPRPRPRRARTY